MNYWKEMIQNNCITTSHVKLRLKNIYILFIPGNTPDLFMKSLAIHFCKQEN